MTSISEHNDGYAYLLVVIDVLSKNAWVEALRDKSARRVADAFAKILDRANGRIPICLQSDRGKEFVGSTFLRQLEKRSIEHRVARNPDIKAAVVERLNRTLRERLWRYLTHKNTGRWIDVIQEIVHAYNHTPHSGTKFRPYEVNLYNAAEASENLRKRASQQTINRPLLRRRRRRRRRRVAEAAAIGSRLKYRVGDYVRISRTKNTFEKGYENNFSEEIFRVKSATKRQNNLFVYVLQDLNGETIDGFFYTEELALVGRERMRSDREFRVERVLRTRGRGAKKQALVKWLGYPNKFNSWINYDDLTTLDNGNDGNDGNGDDDDDEDIESHGDDDDGDVGESR